MNLKTGHQLAGGRYKVERVLGQGGFGITYLAEQIGLMRKVAIKEFFMREYCEREHETASITLGSSGSREMVERFRQKFIKEARALAALNHKHIVRIIDIFEENNTAYYVMEYVDGGSLSDKVKAGALPEATAVSYIRQIATALDFVHGKHMMHLDVKPSNILLNENDETVLIDFGLAKQYDESGTQTSTTPVGISHGYAPLEQYKQGGVGTFSPATDIYSLGATLYKLLTGETPPEAGDVNDDGLPALPQHISASVRAAVEAAMQPRRKDRPQRISEFLALLDKNVKAESGKMKTESNDDGETVIVNSSTPGGEVSRSDGGENVEKSKDERAKSKDDDDGATEILHSVQDDKYRENSSSTNLGEVPQAEGYNPNRASVISSESEKPPVNGENEILRSAQNDKKRPDNAPKHPSSKKLFIISAALICIIAAIFGIKSCNDRKAADAHLATAIAEQQRIEADRKAQERADSIAAERQRIVDVDEPNVNEVPERLAAEKKRKEEEERKRKEEEYARTHGTINGREYVDLGLSVKWATCNVGASSPGEYGNHYAWGETTTKSDYTEANSTTYGKQMNSIAGNSTYDVARREWGGTWRLPTEKEFQELIDNCTWTCITQNGHNGHKVTSKKNGNSIFLPFAGWRSGTSLYGQGTYGLYRSATSDESNTDDAYYLGFDICDRKVYWDNRCYGLSVRPVCE